MTRRARIWLVVAIVFAAINAGGAVVALRLHEVIHAGIHIGLLVPALYLIWRIVRGASAADVHRHART